MNTLNIDIRLHFLRNVVSQDMIKLEKVHLDYNTANMGTKVITLVKLRNCLTLLNIDTGT